jgi:hypothetical protein
MAKGRAKKNTNGGQELSYGDWGWANFNNDTQSLLVELYRLAGADPEGNTHHGSIFEGPGSGFGEDFGKSPAEIAQEALDSLKAPQCAVTKHIEGLRRRSENW